MDIISIAAARKSASGGVTRAYVDEQDAKKTDKVTGATAGNLASLDASGNLADSGSKAADFIISGSATGTAITLTDSADARVQGLTVYGRSNTSKNILDPLTLRAGDYNGTVPNIRISQDLSNRVYCNAGDTFTISSQNPTLTNGTLALFLGVTDITNTIIQSNVVQPGTLLLNSVTFSVAASGYLTPIFGCRIGANNQQNITVNECITANIQLERGSNATAYEPYFEGIKSVGDDGLTITTANSDNTVTTSAEFTTALPLRSTLDGATRDELIIGNGKAEVITRCEVADDSIVPLAEPVTTPLTTAEISAFRQLRTFDSTTNINITDEPEYMLDYLKNTDNGEAISRVVDLLQGADIKAFTYTGTGTVNHSTTFPEVPKMVLAIYGEHTFGSNTWSVSTRPFVWGLRGVYSEWCAVGGTTNGNQMMPATYNGREISFSGMAVSDPGASLNASGVVYTVLYLA